MAFSELSLRADQADGSPQEGLHPAVPFLVFLLPLSPSPALAPGVLRFVAPLVMAVLLVALVRSSAPRGLQSGELLRPAIVLVGVALTVTAFMDPGGDAVERAVSRALLFGVIFTLSTVPVRHVEAILRSFVLGGLAAAVLAIASATTGVSILGGDVAPNRDFLIPLDIYKTTGLPRSYGEFGIILAGCIAGLRLLRPPLLRLGAIPVIVVAVAASQSRNVILTCLVAVILTLPSARRSIGRGAWMAIVVAAFLVPLAVERVVSSSELVSERFVGQGIYERNISARTGQVGEFTDALRSAPEMRQLDGMDRQTWHRLYGVSPHNHFLSLLAFDGVFGLAAIVVLWGGATAVLARRRRPLLTDAGVWLPAGIVALSFYEGAFSPSVAVLLGLAFATADDPLPEEADDELAISR
jgi:hypothetical protein